MTATPSGRGSAGVERKSAREIEVMRAAGRILARVLAEMRAATRPGASTRQIDAVAEKVIGQHGAQPAFKGYPGPYPYPFATTISVNEQLVHGLPSPRLLKDGDLVSLDCGVRYQGFFADAAISVGVGDCAPEDERLLAITEQALWAGISRARPDGRVGDVSAQIQAVVEEQGYHLARDYTGHGIGRAMHEEPNVPNVGRAGHGRKLLPGMVLAVEPMVIVGTEETLVQPDGWTVVSADGSLTCHMEHTVAVTDGEPQVLTALDAP